MMIIHLILTSKMHMVSIKTRHKDTHHIKYLLFDSKKSFFSVSSIQDNSVKARIVNAWPTLMGKLIDKYTSSLDVYNNTLFIGVSISTLKTDIQLSKTKIIEKINSFLGHNFIQKISIVNAKR